MTARPEDSVLRVRRSVHIKAPPSAVWEMFSTFERMESWWGFRTGDPEAGTSKGHWLVKYEAHRGGRIEMEVAWDGARVRYGGEILVFSQGSELTFENDWIPSRGWNAPTFITLRLEPALEGTLVELFHHGFERTGDESGATHAGYEEGWGMTQLLALRRVCEVRR